MMVKFNRFIYILGISFMSSNLISQIACADSVSTNVSYQNLNVVLSLPGHACYTISDSIDLNSDNIEDLKFKYGNCASPSYNSAWYYVTILNPNFQLLTNAANTLWPDTISIAEVINGTGYWSSSFSNHTLRFYEYHYGPSTSSFVYGYHAAINTYMAFREINANDTLYGWILLEKINGIPLGIIIRSFAKENGIISISENVAKEFLLFPNPVSQKLIIKNTDVEIIKVQLYNLRGEEIQLNIISKIEYDVSDVAEGIYFLKIETARGIKTNKLLISR